MAAKTANNSRDSSSSSGLENIIEGVLKKHPDLKEQIETNPTFYRPLLEKTVSSVYEQYRGPIYWGKTIDKIDKITAIAGLASDLFPVTFGTVSTAKNVLELAPKALYGAYYAYKTGDYKALPYWVANEALSFIPGVGELLDMRNIYINRAQKKFAEAVKKKFNQEVSELRKAS